MAESAGVRSSALVRTVGDRNTYELCRIAPAMAERTVVVEVNQQQAQMLDRLIAEGGLGESYGEVIRSGFHRFCQEHPELLGDRNDPKA